MNSDELRWFAEEVQPHEPVLKAYLRASFPTVGDVDDIVQESYLRIWRARIGRPIVSAKAFLFQVARNLAIDRVRRDRGAPTKACPDLGKLAVIEDRPDAVEALVYLERVRLVADALAALPARCRTVIVLCKFQRKSHREAGEELGLSPRTVESQLACGMKLVEKQ